MAEINKEGFEKVDLLASNDLDVSQHSARKRPLWRFLLVSAAAIAIIIYHFPIRIRGVHNCGASSIVDKVLFDTPLLDGHNDLPIALRFLYRNHIYGSNFTNETTLQGQVDFPRLRKGRLGAQFWSVYTSCPSTEALSLRDDPFPDELYTGSIRETLQQIDLVHRLEDRFPANLADTRTADQVLANYKHSPGRISSLLGAEGLHQIGNSPSTLRLYYSLGVRYVTLTHVCHNKYADSASKPPFWHGLSQDGKAIIREMNRIGMIVDLAHTSPDTMRQTLDLTEVPVLFSHASAYGVCAHPRNVPDDVLHKLKDNGGVVMITFVNDYINCEDPAKASLSDVADHIEYVGRLIGYRHVGIGSDFDGMLTAPAGLEDVSKYPALLEELASRGLTLEELKGVAGGNALRVLHAVEAASRRMKGVRPLEDDVARMRF